MAAPSSENDAWTESRLTGMLALDENSSVDSILVLRLSTRQILYHRNITDPTSAALASFDAWASSARLYCGDEPVGTKTLMLKIYKPSTDVAKNSHKVIYSDENYLLCADVSVSLST